MTVAPNAQTADAIDLRLDGLKAVDIILATLQATLAEEHLIDGSNPFRFMRNDPKNSRVWITDSEGRTGFDRSGNRLLVVVYRADFQPTNLHLANHTGGDSDRRTYSDLCMTNVYVECEAGNKTQSEILASICYRVLKMFRLDMMREFDVYDILPVSISPPTKADGTKGEAWKTLVSVRVQTQESYSIKQMGNHFNRAKIEMELTANTVATVNLDATPQGG